MVRLDRVEIFRKASLTVRAWESSPFKCLLFKSENVRRLVSARLHCSIFTNKRSRCVTGVLCGSQII